MKTSGIVSSLLTASLASAFAIERRQLLGLGSSDGGVSVCLDIFGGGCAKTTSTTAKTTSTTAKAVVATPVVATPVVATPVVATPVVATPVVATPVVTSPLGQTSTVQVAAAQVTTTQVQVAVVNAPTSTSTSASAGQTVAASSNTNNAVAYNAQNDYTLNSYTGYYGQGCPSAFGPNANFPTTTLLTSLYNPLQVLSGFNYETTPNDVCTQLTFVIPASTTGWKTCTFNVQVPSWYELSKDNLSYEGAGDFKFDGVANGLPFDFNLPLINWYGTAPGLSKVVGSAACNIPAGVTTTVVGRLCSTDTTVKYAHTADTCKVGVYIQTFA